MIFDIDREKSQALVDLFEIKFSEAKRRKSNWLGLWQDCYDYALPQRGQGYSGGRRGEELYDATAQDAVDELASILLANLTPPLVPWFSIKPGTDLDEQQSREISGALEKASRVMQAHFDQSNFLVEVHQCFLDLIVCGTSSLAFEEADLGESSAFLFSAVPMQEIYFLEGGSGRLDFCFRPMNLTKKQIMSRYKGYEFENTGSSDDEIDIVEVVLPVDGFPGYVMAAYIEHSRELIFFEFVDGHPFINFRWMKSPGEVYGRSPVMKVLPDIKTANKVVELILKNASISVAGIWQADDDGVINPYNIELLPGAIIPKAVGSKGLTPLEMPARFDVSQLILKDLRDRIRHSLLVDRLPAIGGSKVTATEILERSNQMSMLLGATFGRLQVEFLNPLIRRAYSILRQRGVVPDLPLDGRVLAIEYRSPLAKAQAGRHVQTMIGWLETASSLGGEAMERIDRGAVVDYLADILGVPSSFRKADTLDAAVDTAK